MSAGLSDQLLQPQIFEYLKETGDWVPLSKIVKVSKQWDASIKKQDAPGESG